MKKSELWKPLALYCIFLLGTANCLPGAQRLWRSWEAAIGEPILAQKQLNITSVVGKTVNMPCRVKNLGNRKVSWIRGKDLTVIAVDTTTYTGDERFSVKHDVDSEDWLLRLRGVLRDDEGLYDCQVNTYPKLSTKVYLKVVSRENSFFDRPISDTGLKSSGGTWRELSEDPVQSGIQERDFPVVLAIKGGSWTEVELGKSLQLTCEATRGTAGRLASFGGPSSPTRPSGPSRTNDERILDWTLDDVPMDILFPEWKVNVQEIQTSSGVESHLRLNSITPEDAGKVTCVAPEATPASVNFEVQEKKTPKQHYLGLSKSRIKQGQHHVAHTMTSAVSAASETSSGEKISEGSVLRD